MIIGIVSDIHEHVEHLRRALDEFQRRGVDQVVTLGDTCDGLLGIDRASEVVDLLRAAEAVGVWGNHDFGLCYELTDDIRQRYGPDTLAFLATMQGHLAIGDCLFSHVEPWLDPHEVGSLWCYDGPPDSCEKAQKSFQAVRHRFLFIGHFHRWLLTTPTARIEWNGERTVVLDQEPRCLVVVAAVVNGQCGIFDTATCELTPMCL